MQLVTNLIETANQFMIEQLGEYGPLYVAAGLGVLLIAIGDCGFANHHAPL